MEAGSESDAALIDAWRRGDRGAFASIIGRYQRAVYAVSFSSVRDRALSDDITQDTFVTAWRRLGELRDTAKLPAWLCGIARNHARDVRKRRRHEVAVPVELADEATPFDALSAAESERLVAAALDGVPDAYREALVLFYYEGRSADEVARVLGLSVANTHQRLSRGRRCLAERMTVAVERGLTRRGPKAELVACVLAAIAVLVPASHVDASTAVKGSTMQGKLVLITIASITVTAVGVMSADTSTPKPKAPAAKVGATKAPARAPVAWNSVTPEPKLATAPAMTAPACEIVGAHLAGLIWTPKLAKHYADKCTKEKWSENVRLCIVDAKDYQRSQIDCTDEAPATAVEVAALPAELRCDVLAQHVYVLATGPDGKFTKIKKKLADSPKRAAAVDRMTLVMRADTEEECNQRPWSVARRRCIAAAETHEAFGNCK